jgi:hypothetical protein
MFGLFKKISLEEKQKLDIFEKILSEFHMVNRFSYRKNGVFEVIFDGNIGSLTDQENQAKFHLLANAWMVIWDSDKAELHVGVTNRVGYRIEIDAAKLYIGHKYQDHDEMLNDLINQA